MGWFDDIGEAINNTVNSTWNDFQRRSNEELHNIFGSAADNITWNSSSSWDPLGDINKGINDIGKGIASTVDQTNWNQIGNYALQLASRGIVGLGDDGKLQAGVLTHGVDEAIGEVTGRNATRKQMMMASDAANAEAANRAKQLVDERQRQAQMDMEASRAAGSANKVSVSMGGTGVSSASDQASSFITRDFLGI